ncbi:stealth conserved region 3 domain-containing protein [Paludibacter sp.]
MTEIDFVITWVDMNDSSWRKSLAKHSGKIDNSKNEASEARFRDYGLLKYWFRGVEKFAPWVRNIHFVTCGQQPDWLNINHPKLKMVNHEDFIPNEFLPVFNSNVIEIYLYKIPELADKFVYFNDDVFIIRDTPETRFFKNNLPNDIAAFRTNYGLSKFEKMLRNNIRLINKHFNKKEIFERDTHKWFDKSYGKKSRLTKFLKNHDKFVTLRTPHNAQPYLKRTFEDVWKNCEQELIEMSANRFRSNNDYTPELFRTWQICNSDFNPYNTYQDTKMFPLLIKSAKAIKAVREQTYSLVCLNDNVHIRNYDKVMGELKASFESILPDKSDFEL